MDDPDAQRQLVVPPAVDYHSNYDAISRSMLWTFCEEGVDQYAARYVLRLFRQDLDGPFIRKGLASHSILFEPERFAERYAVMPAGMVRRGKAYKSWMALVGDRQVLSASEYMHAFGVAQAARMTIDKLAASAEKIIYEKDIYWTDRETGLKCRARPDVVIVNRSGSVWVPDLKSCRNPQKRPFKRSVRSLGYWLQQSHYSAAVEAEYGRCDKFFFLAAKSSPAYQVRVYRFSDRAAESFDRKRLKLLRDLKRRYETGDWIDPESSQINVLDMELPEDE